VKRPRLNDGETLGLAVALRHARRRRKLTQKELAKACGLEVSFVHRVERGRRRPSRPVLQRLCKALKLDPKTLDNARIKPTHVRLAELTLEFDELLESLTENADVAEQVMELRQRVRELRRTRKAARA